jgi:hypothetical protein
MKLLVSLCNQNTARSQLPGTFLCEVDTEARHATPIPLEIPGALGVTGIMGLAHFGEDLLAVTQGAPALLLRLTRQYDIRKTWLLHSVKDAHSLTVADGTAYIASPGTDSVVAFDARRGERVFWQDNDQGRDTIHLNSVLCTRGNLYATAFGKKQGDDWRSAENGYLINLTTGAVVVAALYHPHSVTRSRDENDLYFCESQRMVIGRADGQRLRVGSSYPRGLVVTATELCVGFSRARLTSRSRQPEGSGWMPGKCGVQVYRRAGNRLGDTQVIATVDLDAYGAEIYDLLAL